MIYSRHPLRELGRLPTRFGGFVGELRVPGAKPVIVHGVHPVNPLFGKRLLGLDQVLVGGGIGASEVTRRLGKTLWLL